MRPVANPLRFTEFLLRQFCSLGSVGSIDLNDPLANLLFMAVIAYDLFHEMCNKARHGILLAAASELFDEEPNGSISGRFCPGLVGIVSQTRENSLRWINTPWLKHHEYSIVKVFFEIESCLEHDPGQR
jgi:hypothetical protein